MTKAHADRDTVKPIKFNGPQPAVLSVASYDGKTGTEFGIMPIAVAKPLVDAGKVKAIGFTGTKTMPQYPNVPLLNTVAPGINVYAAWSIELPANTSADVVAWYQKTFAAAIRSKEYKEWREQNVVFYEESELTPEGLKKQMVSLRETFLPVLQRIDLAKE
jgi:tripartite-type tricarboxylate transporter receptor subunit TctC